MNYNGKWNAVNYYDVVEIIFLARNSEPMSPDFIYNHKGWMLYAGPDTAIHDSLKVGDTTFYPVVKSSGSYDNYKNVTVYTAKNVGIVRRVINTNPKQVWDLVRWKIYK